MYCTVQLIDCCLHIFFSTDPVKLNGQSVIFHLVCLLRPQHVVVVLDLVSQVRDVVLMNVYLDLGDPWGSGFWNEGYMSKGREWEDQFTSNLGTRWTGSYHSKEGSK
jgi:hypothetical protein